jgi:hypothetical protein
MAERMRLVTEATIVTRESTTSSTSQRRTQKMAPEVPNDVHHLTSGLADAGHIYCRSARRVS